MSSIEIITTAAFLSIFGLFVAYVFFVMAKDCGPIDSIRHYKFKSALEKGDFYKIKNASYKMIINFKKQSDFTYEDVRDFLFEKLPKNKYFNGNKEHFFKTYSFLKNVLERIPTDNNDFTIEGGKLLSTLLDAFNNFYVVNKDGVIVKIDLDNQKLIPSNDSFPFECGLDISDKNVLPSDVSIYHGRFHTGPFTKNRKYDKYDGSYFISTPAWLN